MQDEFLKFAFSGGQEKRLFMFGLLSDASVEHLMNRIHAFSKEFNELHRQDLDLPLDKRNTIGLMLAMRPWAVVVFQPLLR